MFRNFYVTTTERGEFDAFNDGEYSCAFFVSSLLLIFKKINRIHGLVNSTVEDLKSSGWQLVQDEPKAGDILVWEAIVFEEGPIEHIGFAIGGNRAVSTSWKQKSVVEHEINFGEQNRKIEQIFRMENWEDNDPQAS